MVNAFSSPQPRRHGLAPKKFFQPLAGALVLPGADQALHVGLHEHSQHRLGDAAQEVTVSCFRQQPGEWQSVIRSSGPRSVRGELRNSTPAASSDGHLSPTPRPKPECPPPPRTLPPDAQGAISVTPNPPTGPPPTWCHATPNFANFTSGNNHLTLFAIHVGPEEDIQTCQAKTPNDARRPARRLVG